MADSQPVSAGVVLEVHSNVTGEDISIPLSDIFDKEHDFDARINEVRDLLISERAHIRHWVRLIEECWHHARARTAFDMLSAGLRHFSAPGQYHGAQPEPTRDCIPLFLLKATYHLALARRAPHRLDTRLPKPLAGPIATTKDPNHPEFGALTPIHKEEYLYRADMDLREAERLAPNDRVCRDVRASWLTASGKLDSASKAFEGILAEEPNHLMALMGRARIQFSSRAFRPALKTYQQVLKLAPSFQPDPRIGIGLCFWMLGDREKARRAWERSMAVNPSSTSPSAPLLLGLAHLNASKDSLHPGGDSARQLAYEQGIKLVQQAFKLDNTSATAAAMAPMAAHMQMMGGVGATNALKLAERMLAFADSRLLVAEAHLARARAVDSNPDLGPINGDEVLGSFQEAAKANPDEVMAQLGVGSYFVRTEQFPAAINAYETLLRRHPKCVEALAALASINTHLAFTFHSVSDSAAARKAAKEHYGAVLRVFSAGVDGLGGGADKSVAKSERVRVLAQDRDLYVEVARLWSDEPTVERSLQAWEKAAQIEEDNADDEDEPEDESQQQAVKDESQTSAADELKPKKDKKDPVDPRVRNNLGVCHFNRRPLNQSGPHLDVAAEQFELALSAIASKMAGGAVEQGEANAMLTAVTFNAAAAYEARGEREKARQAWEQVVRAHPEFVEAKARLALLHLKSRHRSDWDHAHVLLKEALTSNPTAELRALYTYFLVETGQHKIAREFARSTLKELSRHDLYALCASGMLSYHDARENKSQSKDAQRDRAAKYTRAAEFFDKALQLHPQCAFAAQGLAIALAEGALGNGPLDGAVAAVPGAPGQAPQPLTEHQARLRNARDALSILNKVKESVNEASVYVNIGHCHFARDEYDKAIENYTMASKRYLNDRSSTFLWYLARAWYHKSLREQNYSDLQNAIEVGEKATALNPTDLANVFNMAVLKQKGFEILSALPNERRTSDELKSSLEHLQASQTLFEQLAADQAPQPAYPRDLVKARLSYGNSLQKRFDEILQRQLAYEATEQGKLDQARQQREKEQAKRDEAERERLELIKRQAEALAEQRKKMREEAEQWAALSNQWVDDDEEDGKKRKGGAGGKKRKTKMKEGDEGETESDDDVAEKPAKKKRAAKPKEKKEKAPKKKSKAALAAAAAAGDDEGRKMDVDEQYDEDDEDAPIRAPKRKTRVGKNVKSAEFIESSDEDDE